jgi:hypothetical protein
MAQDINILNQHTSQNTCSRVYMSNQLKPARQQLKSVCRESHATTPVCHCSGTTPDSSCNGRVSLTIALLCHINCSARVQGQDK